MLTLSQLRCFVAVATELHFARAAGLLNMTQPPLTRQIQLLEHNLGVQLLERNRKHVRLTPAGLNFFKEAQDILRRVQMASLAATRFTEGVAGHLRVGFIPAAGFGLLPRLFQIVGKSLPGVKLTVTEMPIFDQLEALAADRLDVGLVRPLYCRLDLHSACIVQEPFIVAAPVGHPLAKLEKVPLSALDQQTMIMYSPADGPYMYEILMGRLRTESVAPIFAHYIGHTHSILSLVGAGLGFALVPESARRMQFSDVTYRDLETARELSAELHICWSKSTENPAIAKLIALLHEGRPALPSGNL